MNTVLLTLAFLSSLGDYRYQNKRSNFQSRITPDEVLKTVSDNLNKCSTIKYLHERDYFTGDQHYLLKGYNFIDFRSADTIIQMKYHTWSETKEFFFNGTESFLLDKKSKSLAVNTKPDANSMDGGSFFGNSLVSLRRTLPLLIADESIKKELRDTILNNSHYYLINFSLFKKTLNSFGGYFPIIEERTFSYKLIINKTTFLPFCLLQVNNVDEHSSTTIFSEIETNGAGPVEQSWYYSTYLNEYALAGEKKELPLLPVGVKAPAFELPLFNTGKTISSLQYKNKVVLLEFWIRNCGPCIAAVPELNRLQEKFKMKGLEILAVNPHDATATITYFINKYRSFYPIAYHGEELAKQFGVSAFPVAFIINKKGEIIYAGSFNNDVITRLIEKAL